MQPAGIVLIVMLVVLIGSMIANKILKKSEHKTAGDDDESKDENELEK